MFTRLFYTLLFYLLIPLVMLRLLWRSRRAPAYRQRWGERFGFYGEHGPAKQPCLWLHTVSVGEFLAAVPLVQQLLQRQPAQHLVITTTTPTGSERVQTRFAEEIRSGKISHVYAPYDIPCALNRFHARFNPQQLVIMETELWPNMVHSCSSRHIPVLLANARLSAKSAAGYRRIAWLVQPMMASLSAIAAQHDDDAKRFVALGVDPMRVQVTGSIKFDLDLPPALQHSAKALHDNWSNRGQRPVWLVASTHPGEDDIILRVFARLKKEFSTLLLMLVPRHPERFNTVYEQCITAGFRVQRRSQSTGIDTATDILLGDTMGELLLFYGACDVAFVGGSLVATGGHNLVEPAAWAKPILSGTHLHNFEEIARLLRKAGGLVLCINEDDLLQQVKRLLQNPEARRAMGAAALAVAASNRGALHKLLDRIEQQASAHEVQP